MQLVRSSKTTSSHTLPSITLMKNSAAELYATDQSAAYQHAFGFIRQLAVHLRNSMKVKSKVSLFNQLRLLSPSDQNNTVLVLNPGGLQTSL